MPHLRIASLDFETANPSDASICAAGVSIFEGGEFLETRHWLVRPPKGHGWFHENFIAVHGITHRNVFAAREFPEVAAELLPLLTAADLVIAHNALFDLRMLRGTLHHYEMAHPGFPCLCTCRAARRTWPHLPNHKLGTVANHIGHTFHHHHAGEDAEAAGRAIIAMMKQSGTDWLDELSRFETFSRMEEAA